MSVRVIYGCQNIETCAAAMRHLATLRWTLVLNVCEQNYLQKYGYLQCSTARRRRRHIGDVAVREGRRSDERGRRWRRPCSETDVQEAVLRLQDALRLRPTGRLDVDTQQAMSHRRCGNDDVAVAVAVSAAGRDHHRGYPAGHLSAARRRRVIRHADRRRHRRRRHNRRPEDGRGTTARLRIDPSALPPAPAAIHGPLTESVPSTDDEWRRRAAMLRQIRTRVTAELDRPTTAHERYLASAVSRLATARRVRKRRSLRAVSIDQVGYCVTDATTSCYRMYFLG